MYVIKLTLLNKQGSVVPKVAEQSSNPEGRWIEAEISGTNAFWLRFLLRAMNYDFSGSLSPSLSCGSLWFGHFVLNQKGGYTKRDQSMHSYLYNKPVRETTVSEFCALSLSLLLEQMEDTIESEVNHV